MQGVCKCTSETWTAQDPDLGGRRMPDATSLGFKAEICGFSIRRTTKLPALQDRTHFRK